MRSGWVWWLLTSSTDTLVSAGRVSHGLFGRLEVQRHPWLLIFGHSRHDWLDYIQSRQWVSWFFLSLFLFFVSVCVVCTVYLCAINTISPAMEHKIQEDFLLPDIKQIGYTMLRLFVSLAGIL